MKQLCMDSPAGWLLLQEENGVLTGLGFLDDQKENAADETPLLLEVKKQLEEYFAGGRQMFDVPIAFRGTPFQEKVWRALQKIPYGEVSSYQDLASSAGNEKACRAAGMACNKNPISIIVPCHRVVGKNGSMTGFGGGIWRKEVLLRLERKYSK